MKWHVILGGLVSAAVALSACGPSSDHSEAETERADTVLPQVFQATGVSVDHITIAVADLEAAARHWNEHLGFSIKPGRLHGNTIRNVHMKFADGTELELITAARPVDAVAARYRRLIAEGDGPGFLALRPDALQRIGRQLGGTGVQLAVVRGLLRIHRV